MLRRDFLLGLGSACWPLLAAKHLSHTGDRHRPTQTPIHGHVAVGNAVALRATAGGALLGRPGDLPWHEWSTLLFSPLEGVCSLAGRRTVVVGADERRPWTAYLHFVLATGRGVAPAIVVRRGAPDWPRILGFLTPGVTGERRFWCGGGQERGAEEMFLLGACTRGARYHMVRPRPLTAASTALPARSLGGGRIRWPGCGWVELEGAESSRFVELVAGGGSLRSLQTS